MNESQQPSAERQEDWTLAVAKTDPDWIADRLASALGREAAWLLRSIERYHWRARADMARALVHHTAGMGTHAPAERWSIVDLQCKAWHVEAAEVFARLLMAIDRHGEGVGFFDAYSRAIDTRDAVKAAAAVDAPTLANRLGQGGEMPASMDVDVEALRRHAQGFCDDVVAAAENVARLLAWTERPTPTGPLLKRALRDLTNRFRHGTLVLYPSCAVNGWESVLLGGEAPPESGPGALVYLGEGKRPAEGGTGRPVPDPAVRHWAWVVQGLDSAFNEVRLLEELGVLTLRLARAFIFRTVRPDAPMLWCYSELASAPSEPG